MAEATSTATAQPITEAAASAEVVAATLLGADATKTAATETESQAAAPAPTTDAAAAVPGTTQAETPEAKTAATEAKAEGAPEKYEFKAPEGKEYDPNLISAFEAGAKEANLTQEAAQKLLDQMAPKIAERQGEQVAAIKKEWLESSQSDKEFGGVGLEQNLAIAKKALDSFGSPALKQLLATSGLGNHPEVIRFMFNAGQALNQDKFVAGTAPTRSQVKATSVLYDNTPKQE